MSRPVIRAPRTQGRARPWPLLLAVVGLLLACGLVLGLLTLFDVGSVGELWRNDGGSVDPPGDPRAFDPVASFAAVAAYAGPGATLVRMRAEQVRSDGRLDLTARYQPSPRAQYDFVREVPPPADAPPVGAGAPADGRWRQRIEVDLSRPGTRRYVRKVGKGGVLETQYVVRGMDRREEEPGGALVETIAPPGCPLRDLWRIALEQGVPANAVASIGYDRDGYEFDVRGTRWSLRFGSDCKLRSPG